MSTNLLSYFQSAVRALWPARTAAAPASSPAAPPISAPVSAPVTVAAVQAEATVAAPPALHDETFFRPLLAAFYRSSPHVKTTYETWLHYSRPDESKRKAHFEKSLADYEVRRAAQHAERKRDRPKIPDLPPLREDELKSLRLSSDQSFSIQARGAKMEFIHQLQAFLRALKVSGDRAQLGEDSGYLRKEFSFAPLPETKEHAVLKAEIATSYVRLRHEVEDRADYLLRLMTDILQPAPAASPATPSAMSPVAAAVDQIMLPASREVPVPLAGSLLAAEPGESSGLTLRRPLPDAPAAQIR